MADYNKELSKVRGPFRVYPKKKKEEPSQHSTIIKKHSSKD